MAEFLGHEYVTPITVRSNQPSFTSDTLNLRIQTVDLGVQRWEFGISFLESREGDLHADLMGHYLQFGNGDAFNLEVPQNTAVENRLTASGTVNVNAAAAAGANVVNLRGTGLLPAGLLITFSNHTKLYQVTLGSQLSSGGNNVHIYPALTTALTTSHTVNYSSVNASVKHAPTNNSVSYSDGVLQRLTWNFIENL